MPKNSVSCDIDALLGVSDRALPKMECPLCKEWGEAEARAFILLLQHRQGCSIARDILASWWITTRKGEIGQVTLPKSEELQGAEARVKRAKRAHLRCDRCTILIGPEHHERDAHYMDGSCLCGDCVRGKLGGRGNKKGGNGINNHEGNH
jgi:hypothetical protein